MRRCVLGAWGVLAVTVATSLILAICVGQTAQSGTQDQARVLRKLLQTYLGDPYSDFEREDPTRYSSALVDLNDDGKSEVIVFVSGRARCGSGGCVMLILVPQELSYRVITKTTLTRLPIRLLATKSNGWHEVSVSIGGGGIQPGHRVKLTFDGTRYPTNPTVAPAMSLTQEAKWKTLIPETARGELLYP